MRKARAVKIHPAQGSLLDLLAELNEQGATLFEQSCADLYKPENTTAENLTMPEGVVSKGSADIFEDDEQEVLEKEERAKPLSDEELLERMRLNSPLWQKIESDIRKHCQYSYGEVWEDVASETMFRFLRYNKQFDENASSYHKFWCKKNAIRAYRDLGYSPLVKASNTREKDEAEYGANVSLVSYEGLVEEAAFEAKAREVDMDLLLRKRSFLESDKVPEKHKRVFSLWCLGITDLEISKIMGTSRVRITQIRGEIEQYIDALGLKLG